MEGFLKKTWCLCIRLHKNKMAQNVSLECPRWYWDWKVYEESELRLQKLLRCSFFSKMKWKKQTTNKISISSTFTEKLYNLCTTCRQSVIYWLIKMCKCHLETTQYNQYNMTNVIQTGKIFLEIYGLFQDLRLYQIKLNLIENIVLCS